MDNKEESVYLKKVNKSQDEAIIAQQKELLEAKIKIEFLEQQLINCQSNLDITKTNMINAITEQNRVQNEYGAEIQELKNKIKKLEAAAIEEE